MRFFRGLVVFSGAIAACGGGTSTVTSLDAGGSGDDGGTDGGQTCVPPNLVCGSVCTSVTNDPSNCGQCGKKCLLGANCIDARCVGAGTIGYAVRKVFLGETDRNGVASATAWQSYGENIDGLVTTNASTDVCTRAAGASSSNQQDGPNGLDNAFGKTFIPFVQPFAANPSKTTSDAIEAGGRTPMLVMDASYTLGADAASVPTAFVHADPALGPAWNGNDVRKMSYAWTDGSKPTWFFQSASIKGGLFTSGDLATPVLFDVPFGSGPPLRVHVHRPRLTMRLSQDGITATQGLLTGVIQEAELEDAIAKAAGSISTDLCSGATLDSIKQTIKQAADIMQDGTNAPGTTCDGISVGIGFEAVAVKIDGIGPQETPPPDPCHP